MRPTSDQRGPPAHVTAIAVLVALAVGAVTGYWLRPAPSPPDRDQPGPTGWTQGVPTGYAQSEYGAAAAAMNHLVTLYYQGVAADERDRVLGVVGADGAEEWLDEHITEAVGPDEDAEWPVGRTGAIGYEVVSHDDTESTVEIWLGGSVAGDGPWGLRAVPGRVARMALAWEEGDWRVSRAQLLEVTEEMEERLDAYGEVWHVPAAP